VLGCSVLSVLLQMASLKLLPLGWTFRAMNYQHFKSVTEHGRFLMFQRQLGAHGTISSCCTADVIGLTVRKYKIYMYQYPECLNPSVDVNTKINRHINQWFLNVVPRFLGKHKTFNSIRLKIHGGWIFTRYHYGDQIKADEMGRACRTHERRLRVQVHKVKVKFPCP
jgi:hypothetical protein